MSGACGRIADDHDAGTPISHDASNTCETACAANDVGAPPACIEGLASCNDQCVDEKTDPHHCGDCVTSCVGICNQGHCCDPPNAVCASACVDTTSDVDNCGACGKACDAGLCVSSSCDTTAYEVGNYTPFNNTTSNGPGFLFGNRVTLTKPAKLIELGIVSMASGPDVTMALYTDSGGQAGSLVAYTASTWLSASDQRIAANTEATLSAASYWIMAVFDSEAHIDGGQLPVTFGPSLSYYTGDRYNFYLVVD